MTKTRITLIVVFLGSFLSYWATTFYAESLNEVTPLEREQLGIRFKLGTFQSRNRPSFYSFWYIGEIRKHQDFESCVVTDSTNNNVANWAIMTSQIATEVCLFQIARHFKDIDELRSFFEKTSSIRTMYSGSDLGNRQFLSVRCKQHVKPCAFPDLGLLPHTRESAAIRYIDKKLIYVKVSLKTK